MAVGSANFGVGVDGCRGGWLAVMVESDTLLHFGVHRTIDALAAAYRNASVILVDVPIGLVDGRDERECDRQARRLLGRRASCVFPVPCRRAVEARDSSRVNQHWTGRKLSRQSLGIVPKIAEVDRFLRGRRADTPTIREVHPEVCFWALDGGQPMALKKKSAEGALKRVQVLERYVPDIAAALTAALKTHRRREFGCDDFLDAVAAAVTARGPLRTLPGLPPRDRYGLPMEMVYRLAAAPS